ncbi:ornithine cyclodeaminase [Rhizobium leguminosarum]|uniref:ornithine cyclodeaminase n=1 Tax=Rhizobium leguminosarum TaxID=384 RepID=UPI001040CFFE|nr:ornithine cyclodeaminase [Rhizobium leguminosarum]TBZ41303.1 ornithine cyclodeaminase [Rhizobium leguminosarum bv. viciae]TCA09439.1 ornithine cyclodeaminase [Rhizobium leguminosarum bv. viciae]TCA18848.1 ornithine cyclodeaminase [Rhizobium leguminosarum bv. viciae]
MFDDAISTDNNVRFLTREELRSAGAELTIAEIHAATDTAWSDIKNGTAFGGKAVLSLPEEEFWQRESVAPFRRDFVDERLGWKLSSLYCVNATYGGVKIIGANAFNRHLGLPRSTSTILLLEKRTLRPLAIFDGTAISALRTGTYASRVVQLFVRGKRPISGFLFGSGPVARSVIECLNFSNSGLIGEIFIRSRSVQGVEKLISDLTDQTSFRLHAVSDNKRMKECAVVITATNARQPLFEDEELDTGAVTLHLGGDEVPETYLQRALKSGTVVCDDIKTVCRRNSQSIALYFSRRALSLEEIGPLLGVRELSAPADWIRQEGTPVCVTCVGLPMLDLYAAQAIYEKYLALKHRTHMKGGPS